MARYHHPRSPGGWWLPDPGVAHRAR